MSDPEGQVDPSVIPPLDATLLRLSDTELAFLHSTISEDDDKLKKIVGDVQKRWAPTIDMTLPMHDEADLPRCRAEHSEIPLALLPSKGSPDRASHSEMYPYPCIRAFHFVSLMMATNDVYPAVLETGKRVPHLAAS